MKPTTAGGTKLARSQQAAAVAEHAQLQREAQLVAGAPPGPTPWGTGGVDAANVYHDLAAGVRDDPTASAETSPIWFNTVQDLSDPRRGACGCSPARERAGLTPRPRPGDSCSASSRRWPSFERELIRANAPWPGSRPGGYVGPQGPVAGAGPRYSLELELLLRLAIRRRTGRRPRSGCVTPTPPRSAPRRWRTRGGGAHSRPPWVG